MKITDLVLINDTLFSVVCVYLSISIMIGSLEIWDRAFPCSEFQFQETPISRRALSTRDGAYFGEASGPIWLDDLNCYGNEGNLQDCFSERG